MRRVCVAVALRYERKKGFRVFIACRVSASIVPDYWRCLGKRIFQAGLVPGTSFLPYDLRCFLWRRHRDIVLDNY